MPIIKESFLSAKRQEILELKERLNTIKVSDSTSVKSTKKIAEITTLIELTVMVISDTSDPTLQLACWLLLADSYASIALLAKGNSAQSATAVEQAVIAVEYAEETFASREDIIVDKEFVKRTNTYDLCSPRRALSMIKHDLIPDALKKTEDEGPLFRIKS